MQSRFDSAAYRDRVQVETVMSMIKRRLEPFVRGRNCWSQRRELRLKVPTHNVMILFQIELFYRAVLTPLIARSSPTQQPPQHAEACQECQPGRGFGDRCNGERVVAGGR